MALYKDICRCQKCGKNFTWYYQPQEEEGYSRHLILSEEAAVKATGIMLVTEKIYDVLVDCPYCGAQNEFNCKIEQELPGLKQNASKE